jgi:hypothetical protein
MDLSEIVAIPGMPGLFKVTARRNDGLIVTSLVDDKTQFVSGRTNLFTTLDNITIYTNDEPIVLKEVLASIKKSKATSPDGKDEKVLKAWMEKILPVYDKEKVHVSDMKKLAKWYGILEAKNLIEELTTEKAADETAEATEVKKETAKKETKKVAAKADQGGKSTAKPAPVRKITTPRKAT